MSFRARYNGTCSKCGKRIEAMEHFIDWDRTPGAKKAWHTDCSNPTNVPVAAQPKSPIAQAVVAASTSESAILKQILEALQIAKTLPVPASTPSTESLPEPVLETSSLCTVPTVPLLDSETLIKGNWETRLRLLIHYFKRIIIIGKPGTGKSTTAAEIAKRAFRVLCHEDQGVGDLRGNWQLKNKETLHSDGPSSISLREGRPLILDEIGRASSEIRSLLFNLLDFPAHDTLPTGESITADANGGYAVVATSNESPDSLPEAILDRFDLVLFADMPSSGVMSQIHPEIAPVVTNFYAQHAKLRAREPYKPVPSARSAIVYSRLRSLGVNQETALELVYHGAAREIASAMVTASANPNGGTNEN